MAETLKSETAKLVLRTDNNGYGTVTLNGQVVDNVSAITIIARGGEMTKAIVELVNIEVSAIADAAELERNDG